MLSSLTVIPVHRVMPAALAVVLRKAPLTPEKIAFAWRTAVGPAVDRVTTVALKARVLHVQAKDAAWQREVERSAGVIRARLQALLGDDVVRSIEVAVKG
jgi:Dna[CI] antecedent DciA-like protein